MFMLVLHSIELPPTIPKSSFERDLDFYGLVLEEGHIKYNSVVDMLVSLRGDCDSAKSKHDIFLFAISVNHQYTFNKKSSEAQESVQIRVDELDSSISRRDLSEVEKKLFLTYLDEYFGLKMCLDYKAHNGFSFFVNTPHLCSKGYFYVIRK